MTTDLPHIETFRNRLQQLGADYVCIVPLPATSTSVSFLGSFQGQTVLWNMTLATLQYFRSQESGNISDKDAGIYTRPFIEIDAGKEGVFNIRVGLELELVDEPVIKKSIIMIRNYKRLAIGRIEFGSMHT